ncbi:MAG: M56 family metallopeptidase, partial [Blastocatellia bacterium]
MPWLVGIWFLGVLLLSSRFAAGLSVARRLKRTGTEAAPALWQTKLVELKLRLGVSRPVRLYKSLLVDVPTVVGWLRPVILLPASALTGLGPEQLEALLAHELAHIRRYDYLVNIIQTAVETLLFYHPAVWWISGQVRAERENCCDDLAVSACGDVLTYARALAELESMRTRRPQFAMAADGGSLLSRIERLVGKAGSPKRHQVGPSLAVLAAIAALMIMLAGAGGMEPVLVQGAIQQARIMGIAPLSGFPRFSGSAERPAGDPAKHSADASATAKTEDRRADQSTAASGPAQDSSANSSATAETLAVPQSEKSDDYIGSMKAAFGSKDISIDDLVALKIQGVTAQYIKELRAAGYDKLTIHQVIELKTQDVSADYIKQMASAGYSNLPVNELIAMKIQTVTPDYIRALSEHGFTNLPASRIVAMKIQGVTPEY